MLKKIIYQVVKKLGYTFNIYKNTNLYNSFPIDTKFLQSDFNKEHLSTLNLVKNYTMTSPERIVSLIEAVKYVEKNNIQGDIVECGVWRGGSMMAVCDTLLKLKITNRKLFLFDTFEGMSTPDSILDVDSKDNSAANYLSRNKKNEDDYIWAYSPIDSVKKNIYKTGYPEQNISFIQGKVEDTLPCKNINEISILRLDTDWYESTKHEMIHLFPLLSKGGIIIIDDYGHWEGAKKAIDEYIADNNISLFLARIDYSCRIGIKQ